MQIEFLNTHKKYKQNYYVINEQVYAEKKARQLFGKEFEKALAAKNYTQAEKLKRMYRYPATKTMKTKISEKIKMILKELNLVKTTNVYENFKVANALMYYLINKTNIDMTIIEDRLFNFKNFTEELKENTKKVERAYIKKVYNKDKEFKRTKGLLKKLEKQAKNQQLKMQFNTLVRNKTTNQEDTHTFFSLLKKLNIKAYKTSIINKEDGSKHLLVLVPIKLKKTDTVKYYFYDLTKYRQELKNSNKAKNKENIKILGKTDVKSLYENYEIVSFESDSNAHFKNEPEFNKIFKQISNTGLLTNYTL